MAIQEKAITNIWIADTEGDIVTAGVKRGDFLFVKSTGELRIAHTPTQWTAMDALVNPAGGGSKEYASFYQGTGGVTGVSSAATVLNLSSTRTNSNGTIFSLASNVVTVNKTADFKITVDAYINTTSNNSRGAFSIYLEKEPAAGGGFAEITASRSTTYQRGYGSGQSATISMILSVTTGDKFRISMIRVDGGTSAVKQDNNGTRFTIEEK